MIQKQEGSVISISARRPGATEIEVRIGGTAHKALNYDRLTGPVSVGDRVILNTTAVQLALGTGGYHFVCFNFNRGCGSKVAGPGHLIRLRYTPLQLAVQSCEEDEILRGAITGFRSLRGCPVIIGELHSMVAPAVLTLKKMEPALRLGYLMTDSAALPIAFSRTIDGLKREGLIRLTVTTGQAYGGDLEAVNVYSGLVAAFQAGGVDTVIIAPGPGVTGTGTKYGFSGMEVGENVNRVTSLGGVPVVVPRISFADPRPRHRGLSHHTLTALKTAAFSPAYLPLPYMGKKEMQRMNAQLMEEGLFERHRVCAVHMKGEDLWNMEEKKWLHSMGRDSDEDPYIFAAPAAAAMFTLSVTGRESGVEDRRNRKESTLGS
ncbi:MAG: DUF3866 family protein [Firmicutes bacterium]|nr:DUF3866 family protein [Bacillota bacterium]